MGWEGYEGGGRLRGGGHFLDTIQEMESDFTLKIH